MNEQESKISVPEILGHASKEFDRIAEDLIKQMPLTNVTGIFGFQIAVVERIQSFLSKYPDLIAAKSNEIMEEFDNKIHEHEIHIIQEGLVSLGRERVAHYTNEYFNKPLRGES